MAAPLAPLAVTALRVGVAAATVWYVSRRVSARPKHAWRERALDDTAEGLEVSTDRSEGEAAAHGAGRVTRTLRLGDGPGIEIDISALGRVRLRRVD